MDEPTLQRTLREKYSISDRLLAEGKFVGLIGDHAASLVCLGLGIRCLVVAKIVLSGDIIDYDLISITPLSLLSLSFQNISKKIKIRSQFKPTQVYEICTSANQAEIWDNFTSTIREVYMLEQGDTWCSTTLHPPKTMPSPSTSSLKDLEQTSSILNLQDTKQTDVVIANSESSVTPASSSTDFEKRPISLSSNVSQNSSNISYRSILSLPKFDSRLSDSSVSLPSKLPSQTDENSNLCLSFRRSNSVNLLDVKFESFINDASAEVNKYKDPYAPCLWTGSDDSMKKENKDNLNLPSNFISEDLDTSITNISAEGGVAEEGSGSGTRIGKVLKNAWYCCTGKKRDKSVIS